MVDILCFYFETALYIATIEREASTVGGKAYTVGTLRPPMDQLPLEASFQQLPDSPSTQKQSKGPTLSPPLLGPSNPIQQNRFFFFLALFYFETRFYYVALTGLNLAI